MSNLNPNVPVAVEADPKRPYKAYVATALAFLVTVAGLWINDDGGVTSKEVVSWIITALIGSGLTGGATFTVRNPKVVGLS